MVNRGVFCRAQGQVRAYADGEAITVVFITSDIPPSTTSITCAPGLFPATSLGLLSGRRVTITTGPLAGQSRTVTLSINRGSFVQLLFTADPWPSAPIVGNSFDMPAATDGYGTGLTDTGYTDVMYWGYNRTAPLGALTGTAHQYGQQIRFKYKQPMVKLTDIVPNGPEAAPGTCTISSMVIHASLGYTNYPTGPIFQAVDALPKSQFRLMVDRGSGFTDWDGLFNIAPDSEFAVYFAPEPAIRVGADINRKTYLDALNANDIKDMFHLTTFGDMTNIGGILGFEGTNTTRVARKFNFQMPHDLVLNSGDKFKIQMRAMVDNYGFEYDVEARGVVDV